MMWSVYLLFAVTSASVGKQADSACRTDYPGTCDLTSRDLTEVPEIPAGEKYRNILIDKNRIRSAPKSMLAGHDTEYLSMEDNDVSSIPEDMLTGAYRLKHLNMAHNKVVGIDEDAFTDTANLVRLDLNHNRLGWFPPKAFCDLRNATTILLHNNVLSTLLVQPGCSAYNVTMSASSNPYCCDWRMAWMKRDDRLHKLHWEREHGIMLSPTCDNFPGREWDNISDKELMKAACPVKPELEPQEPQESLQPPEHGSTTNDAFSTVPSTVAPESTGTFNSVLVQVLVPLVMLLFLLIITAILICVFKRRRNAKTIKTATDRTSTRAMYTNIAKEDRPKPFFEDLILCGSTPPV